MVFYFLVDNLGPIGGFPVVGLDWSTQFLKPDGTHIKSVGTEWTADYVKLNNHKPIAPRRVRRVTTLGSDERRQTKYDYEVTHQIQVDSETVFREHSLSAQWESDWYGTGQQPPWLSKEVFSYGSGDGKYGPYRILTGHQLRTGDDQIEARTDYFYDDSGHVSITRPAVPGHEAISWNARNLTRVRQYTAADASAERKMYYDNLGNVVEVRDELQNVAATAFDTA
jgi:hypothetical protein